MQIKILIYLIVTLISYSSFSSVKPIPEMKNALEVLKQNQDRPLEKLTVEEARQDPTPQAIAESEGFKKGSFKKITDIEISDIQVSGAEGKIPARLYTPQGSGKLPVVIYYHGGGWVLGKNEDYDATLKALADKTKAIYLSPEYRKAPEFKFPVAHDDAYAAYLWVLQNAERLGGDSKKVAVAGEGAGGNLALNVSIKARDEKKTIPIHQLIIYPLLTSQETKKNKQEQSSLMTDQKLDWYMDNYLRSPKDLKDIRINLVEANFKGLPATTIITAEIDPLRVEGKTLARKLEKAGVDVTYKEYRGVTHEFFSLAPILNEARQAQEEAADDLKESFKQ